MPGIKVLVRTTNPRGQLASVSATARGPVFDETAVRGVQRHIRNTKEQLGAELVNRIQHQLDKVLVNPTGHYRNQIDYNIVQGSGALVVYDRGVVYGPWLEGTGSRNKTTRFKGYHTFRKTFQQLQGEIDRVVLNEIRVTVKELS